MKKSAIALLATVVAALLSLASDAAAQTETIYLELVGDQGPISALSGTITQGHANETRILSLASNVYVEDLQAMTLSKRPIRVSKSQDPSSPRLWRR